MEEQFICHSCNANLAPIVTMPGGVEYLIMDGVPVLDARLICPNCNSVAHFHVNERRLKRVLNQFSENDTPKAGDPLENWFAYRARLRAAGIKFTLRMIAHASGVSYRRVRKEHIQFKKGCDL